MVFVDLFLWQQVQILLTKCNDNAEDFSIFPYRAAYSTVLIGGKFVSTFVDWGDQYLVPNIGEDASAREDVKEFKYS